MLAETTGCVHGQWGRHVCFPYPGWSTGSRDHKQLVCSWPCSSQHMMGWSPLAHCLCLSYSWLEVKQNLRQFPWGVLNMRTAALCCNTPRDLFSSVLPASLGPSPPGQRDCMLLNVWMISWYEVWTSWGSAYGFCNTNSLRWLFQKRKFITALSTVRLPVKAWC